MVGSESTSEPMLPGPVQPGTPAHVPEGTSRPPYWPLVLSTFTATGSILAGFKPNAAPSVAAVRVSGSTGIEPLTRLETPFFWRVPWYEKNQYVSFTLGTGPPTFPPN